MAEPQQGAAPKDTGAAAAEGAESLEGGSYEVIQKRLVTEAKELSRRTDQLNERRKAVFGGSELVLLETVRVRTENNCVPRDIKNIGGKLLFAFNVFIGLRSETEVKDVFSLHELVQTKDGVDLPELPKEAQGFLQNEAFVRDFKDIYRYNKDTRLLSLRKTEARLLAMFQIGAELRDQRVFRWGLAKDGSLSYIDARGEEDNRLPRAQDFEWRLAGREDQVPGPHPHLSILNEVFVETIGGDLTIKIEDNTQSGRGIYSEPVDDANQTLDDAEIAYARVGVLILLKIKPFREESHRYLVFNTRTKKVVRIDSVGLACLTLPEDQGIVFPGGYYLRTGEYKVFDADTTNLHYRKTIKAPNGEDVLYVFHRPEDGFYLLLPYNLIRKEVSTPLSCHGFCLFEDGRMLTFRDSSAEPTRVHAMQLWKTPFVSAELAAVVPKDGGYLAKVGNAELVRGISEAYTLARLCDSDDPTRQTYEDLIAGARRMVDAYYWLGHVEAFDLKSQAEQLRRTGELVIDEFEKVSAIRKRAQEALVAAEARQSEILSHVRPDDLKSAEAFMGALTDLRKQRGQLITLRELRYMPMARVDALENEVKARFEEVSRSCVGFLLTPGSLTPLTARLDTFVAAVEKSQKAAEVATLGKDLDRIGDGLSLLNEVVSGLAIEDATARTKILEAVSEVYAQQNRARAILSGRRKELGSAEAKAEFVVQTKLLGQAITAAVARAESPERCDEELAKLLVQLEELEGKFGEVPEYVAELAEKREEASDALSARRQTLLDERQRRAEGLASAANRLFVGVSKRALTFKTADELHAYFASDAMVQKLGDLAKDLFALGESVKAEELEGKLKTARQDALRSLRDKSELFAEGENLIKLGAYRFHVTTQALELAIVPRRGELGTELFLHVAGTDFYERIEDATLESARDLWGQTLVSESHAVYRGEYLAASILGAAERGEGGLSLPKLAEVALTTGGLLELTRTFAAERADEGYERGVHDADAALLLDKLVSVYRGAGLLRFGPEPRALGCLTWASLEGDERAVLGRRAESLTRLADKLGSGGARDLLAKESEPLVTRAAAALGLSPSARVVAQAARYLVLELGSEHPRFVTAEGARALESGLQAHLRELGEDRAFADDQRRLEKHPAARYGVVRAWLDGYLAGAADRAPLAPYAAEATALLFLGASLEREPSAATVETVVTGLLGQHERVRERSMAVRLDELLERTGAYMEEQVPRFRAFRKARHELLQKQRARLRLDELAPKVLSTFVRNRLIDEVYLPLIGQNLAKQIGAAGDTKRTDRMGLLLLVSPPGYGKTTLMEYVASRLGLVFVKVNGPALGHDVRSIDPGEAPNATARQEVERINFALEMGNNVMLYLDDIQHTNPELLQKFISLCDGQRRIEGVWKGRSRTYDLRGKRFCVVMAGNPYTESGAKFQIPDMLANRADTYNLGEVLEGKADAFALSYLENALTSNPVTAPLASREPADTHKLFRMAKGEPVAASELSYPYSAAEVLEIVSVLERLFTVQKTLLLVNQEYILSASQEDAYRTEPPFKLQGSYRNMNKVSEKVVSAHTPEEIERLLDDHYAGESQTLTKGAEQNLLKLAELRKLATAEQKARWEAIKSDFVRVKMMGGKSDDPVTRVVGSIGGMGQQVDGIRKAVEQAVSDNQRRSDALAMRPNPTANILRTSLGKIEVTLEALRKAFEEAAKGRGNGG
jgi:hypothetical protein